MFSVDIWLDCGGQVDEASALRELMQPAHAARGTIPTRDDANITSPEEWCSRAAASDGRAVAASDDDATGKYGRRAGLCVAVRPRRARRSAA